MIHCTKGVLHVLQMQPNHTNYKLQQLQQNTKNKNQIQIPKQKPHNTIKHKQNTTTRKTEVNLQKRIIKIK